MDKIEKELESIVRETDASGHLSGHEFVLPHDAKLMANRRYRSLVETHNLHKELVHDALKKLPALRETIQSQRLQLETLNIQEADLLPIIKQINAKDMQAFEELSMVAKHRRVSYERKKKALLKTWKAESEKLAQLRQEKLAKDDFLNHQNARMEEFLKESTARVRVLANNRPTENSNTSKKSKIRFRVGKTMLLKPSLCTWRKFERTTSSINEK